MSRPDCVDYDANFTADYLNNTLRPLMDSAGGYYNASWNHLPNTGGPVGNNMKAGCTALTSILSMLETTMGQPMGAFTSSVNQTNPPTGGVK